MRTKKASLGLATAALFSFAFIAPADQDEIREKVEKSVLQWADNTFEFYDGARFENFKEVPTQEAFALETKIETLKEFKVELNDMFQKGELKKTKEELDKQQAKIDRQIDSLGKLKSKIDPASKDYEINLWANIMVSNAVTVYYQHLVKLNGKFEVTGVRISGAVGTQPSGVKILYKKTAKIKANNRPDARN
jgi:hypothetical protein